MALRKRKENSSILEALLEAQKIAFAPFVFQATLAAKRLGILKAFSESQKPMTFEQCAQKCDLTPYAVQVVCELLAKVNVLSGSPQEGFVITKTGECLLYDPMTSVNLDFTADVCYKGLAHLDRALKEGRPAGLSELGPWETIYPALSSLPEPAKTSWFGFDHFYSDVAFAACAKWLSVNLKPSVLFDVGGNTGKFAGVCLNVMPQLEVVIVDLPQQCALAWANEQLNAVRNRLFTAPVNWLDEKATPATDKKADVIWMSQFLDCFSQDEAVGILTRLKPYLAENGRIAVLECLWDRQKHEAASLSLLSTSLYFTAMANGNSRFFSESELRRIFERAGLEVESVSDRLGVSHTLFVCRIKD